MMRAAVYWVLVVCAFRSVLANVIHVPQDMPTIQAGLNALQDGDTVLIAAGTYAEALIAPPLRFTLKGDVLPDTGEFLRPIIDPSSLPGSNALGCLFLPDSSWPVLEDLIFRNGPQMYPHSPNSVGGVACLGFDFTARRCLFDSLYHSLVFVPPGPNSLDITDSLIDCDFRDMQGIGVHQLDFPLIALNCRFLSANTPRICYGAAGSRFRNCYFGYNPGNGLVLDGDDVEVSDCIFETNHRPTAIALLMHTPHGVVQRNVFANIAASNALLRCLAAGAHAYTVADNTFLNNVTGAGACLRLDSGQVFYPGRGGSVERNVFINCFSGTGPANVLVSEQDAVTFVDNRLLETEPDPFWLPTVSITYGTFNVLRYNLFQNTGYALHSGSSQVDAVLNWWGDSSGPYHASGNPGGMGDTITGAVDFTPWYGDTSFLATPGMGASLPEEFVLAAYPNPFNSTVHLTLIPSSVQIARVEVYDVLGRKVQEVWHGPLAFQKDLTFDASALASGIYFARVTDVISRKNLALTKLVLLK